MAVSNLETISTEDQKKVDHQSDHQNQILQQDEANEQTVTPLSLKAMIEGLIFIAGEDGLSLLQIQSVLFNTTRTQISQVLDEIRKEYELSDHGFELMCFGGRYKFISKEAVYTKAKKLYEEIIVPSLSSAALETLAIIAYRQPITRVEIEAVRGVSCEAMLKKLQARELIETDGRSDAVGKPLLYKVSGHFMDVFGIETLEELPELKVQESEGLLFGSVSDLKGDDQFSDISTEDSVISRLSD
ncbi:SMC-Scp complex subunit ScpB [Ileibacterium valens]|uniref:SMC-Scp complex subunit ScpB n=1 Tax=Ileibacterium valens TaxID=1862668 RepID=UPI00259BA327|nr:SMC-Scp complex subunit ScpB [Ileibacterium valens]